MIADALGQAARDLPAAATPRLDAELLMAHALGCTREALLLRHLRDPVPAAFAGLVARRQAHEPVAYITGTRAFWTIELAVTPDVLIPRPDTETLIEAAVAHFGTAGPARILDLGTGSGALLLAGLAEWRHATGMGIDRSHAAVAVAEANARALGLAGRAGFAVGGWAEAGRGDFDLVLCNPPYVAAGEVLPPDVARHEPHAALFAGDDGLDDYRRIAPVLRLPAHGLACVEIGATQAAAVRALFGQAGFGTTVRQDLAGRDRAVVLSHRR